MKLSLETENAHEFYKIIAAINAVGFGAHDATGVDASEDDDSEDDEAEQTHRSAAKKATKKATRKATKKAVEPEPEPETEQAGSVFEDAPAVTPQQAYDALRDVFTTVSAEAAAQIAHDLLGKSEKINLDSITQSGKAAEIVARCNTAKAA